jgi:uncharacterized protein YdhG (YjbR/CyaY superfamily)
MTSAKKTAATKTAAKKTAAKKTAAKKTAAKKTAATKTAATKTAAKKTAAKKTAAKKTAAKKAPAKKAPTKKTAATTASSASGFTAAERAAMKDRVAELKATRQGAKKLDDLEALQTKIGEMGQPDRALAERIHAIITSVAPELAPKTWYGMPAYAKDGKVVCFFQPAEKFGARYATFGFNDPAHLDDGTMWPTAYAVTALSDADAKRIEELVKRAVS